MPRISLLYWLVLIGVSIQAGIAGAVPIAVSVKVVSTSDTSLEPTLSYAPNGTMWYSGMNATDGSLWFAQNDAGDFTKEPDPPVTGGHDAVVHHDQTGRLYWAELGLAGTCGHKTEVAVKHTNGTWLTYNQFTCADRPWFRTNSTDMTFLTFTANDTASRWVEVWWYNATGGPSWGAINSFSSPAWSGSVLTDFAIHNDTLYLMLRDPSTGKAHIAYNQSGSWNWANTSQISDVVETTYGIPRVVLDNNGNLYAAYGANISGNSSIWLRRFNFTSGEWTQRYQLGPPGHTVAFPSVIAGAAGRLGVAWYEAQGTFLPNESPANKTWRFRYTLFANATTAPDFLESVTVRDKVEEGPLTDFGDFTYATKRQGDNSGRVALAYSCRHFDPLDSTTCPSAGLPPLPGDKRIRPQYAVQTAGQGVIG